MGKILIVDDDARLAHELAGYLTASGHTCHVEVRAETALAFLQSVPQVDLLVLDIMLPVVSGLELCRRLRADARHFALPVLIISAMNDEEEITHGLAQGADDYLTKPLNLQEVLSHVNRLLAENSEHALCDELTELLGSKGIRLEIQKAVYRREHFSLVYVELLNVADFGRSVGAEARAKAIRHLGRGLHAIGHEMQLPVFHVGHLGSGHFVTVIDAENANGFCRKVQHLWQEHLPKFYETVGQEKTFREAVQRREKDPNAPLPILDLLFCITAYSGEASCSAHNLFETLLHLREGAPKSNASGIYSDRRH